MAADFDNLEDVIQKFNNSFIYYDKKPVMVKSADFLINKNNGEIDGFKLMVQGITAGLTARGKWVPLKDDATNYKKYNIGYMNSNGGPLWYYRKPVKQFSQGLRPNQLGLVKGNIPWGPELCEFGFNNPSFNMLENNYPDFEKCREALLEGVVPGMAFHKDFAVSLDNIHNDFILHYKGKAIGATLGKYTREFRLLDQASHLKEALTEVLCANK